MPQERYYIGDNIASNKPNDLSIGARIFSIKEDSFYIKYDDLEGPYENLDQLKKNSKIFQKLIKTDPQRAQKILQPSYIIITKKSILTNSDKYVEKDFLNTFTHIIAGKIKQKKISGIHLFDTKTMRGKKMLLQPDSNYIWKAIVEVYNPKNKKWYEKESTFFPVFWSYTQLFEELDYALQNKIQIGTFLYQSFTRSGIPIKIIIKQNILTTIYPIHNSEI